MNIRSLALVGHTGSGKTTFAEALLFKAGVTSRLGQTSEGTSVLDADPEEVKRGMSIRMGLATLEWKGNRLHVVDTPGYFDFEGDVRLGIQMVDHVVAVVDATSGVEVGTERYVQFAREAGKPRMVVVTRMGTSEEINVQGLLENLRERLGSGVVPLVAPSGVGGQFTEVAPLLGPADTLPDWAQEMRSALWESIVENSEELLEKYLSDEPITVEEAGPVFREAYLAGELIPVFFVDSVAGVGVEAFLDLVSEWIPAAHEMPLPEAQKGDEAVALEPVADKPLVAQVGKIFYEAHLGELYVIRVFQGTLEGGTEAFNVRAGQSERINQVYRLVGKDRSEVERLEPGDLGAVVKLKHTRVLDTLTAKDFPVHLPAPELPEPLVAVAIVPKTKQDEEKVSDALHRLNAEDPTFSFGYDPELKQSILKGMGELHLDVILSHLKEKFGVDVDTAPPRIPYRETIRKPAKGEGKYVKQTGGRGQYGWCFIKIEPLPRGQGYEWVDEIFGGAIPQNFRPSVEQGVKKAMETGVLAGVRVVDVKVTLYDGKYHPVDSSNLAFEIAGSLAFKDAEAQADPYLLEPIYEVEVRVPEEYMGDVIGDLNARRGRILGMDSEGNLQIIRAHVPQAELQGYSSSLRSITKGRGLYTMKFSHYDEVPREIADRVIQALKKEQEEGS